MSSDNPFETLADLERKKKMNAQQKGKQAGGQAKTGGKKKPATTKSGELTAQDRYQKEIQKIKDVLPHIPEDTVIKQLSELNGNVDLVLMKLLEFDAGDSSRNTSSASSKSTNAAKNTPPTTKATNAANNNTANQGFTQPKYHTKGARQADSKQSPSEAPKKFAGQGSANSRGYSQEGANTKTYPPNSNTYPAKGSAKGGSAPSPQQTGGRGGGARDGNNYAPAQQSRGGNAVLPKGPQPRDVSAKPATVMNYSAAVNRNMPAKPQPTPQQQQLSAAEALLATLEDDDFGEEEYQDFDPRDFLDEGAMGEDYIPDDYDPAEDDEEVTQELNITESSLHTLTDSKEVTVNSVTVTTDTAVTEPPSLLNGGQPITRHVQEQHTVTEVVEVGNEKANNGNPALPAAAGYEFPADRTNPNTVPAEAYQQLIVLNIQAAQRIATLETLLQQVVAKTDKLELQNNEMQTVCQQLVKTCLYLSEQQAKLQTAVSSGFPQQQGGQQPPQAQPPQQPSSFPPQPSNQYPQQYQQPTAQAQQSQAPQAKPQGMLAQGPNQGVNPAQPAPQQPQPMPAMYAQPNMNKQQAGFAGQLPHGYPSMHHQYGSSPQNQSPLMQQQYFPQGNQPGYGYPPQGMHHNPAQNRGFPQYSPQFGMQGQHMGLDPEIIEGMVRDQRNAEQMK